MNFCPKNVGNWSSSPQNDSELSPRSIQSLFPASSGAQLQEITIQHFFDPTGSNKTTFPDWIKKDEKTFFDPTNEKQLCIYLGESMTHSQGKKTNFQHFWGESLC